AAHVIGDFGIAQSRTEYAGHVASGQSTLLERLPGYFHCNLYRQRCAAAFIGGNNLRCRIGGGRWCLGITVAQQGLQARPVVKTGAPGTYADYPALQIGLAHARSSPHLLKIRQALLPPKPKELVITWINERWLLVALMVMSI